MRLIEIGRQWLTVADDPLPQSTTTQPSPSAEDIEHVTMEALPQITLSRHQGLGILCVSGNWSMDEAEVDTESLLEELADPTLASLRLEARELGRWDSSLLVLMMRVVQEARARSLPVDQDDLPEGMQRLLRLAFAVPAKEGAQRRDRRLGLLERLGNAALALPRSVAEVLDFFGDIALSVGRLVRARADMRARDVFYCMQECGAEALPIISITSLLFGLILAFVGAVQLTQFGAQIYVAGLVGIGMLRVMGAIMVGVVMSGRMGASYAALIGTMQVNEEVDALSTFGMSPIDFLVLPRVLALTLMTPLLTLYADFMGLVGGFLVGTLMLDINPLEYYNATQQMVPFKHVLIGLVYGTVFGVIVAISGCYQGIRCGRSAAAVGQATTAAVVNAIVGIIIATAIITLICNALRV